jgi:hypothetical protein
MPDRDDYDAHDDIGWFRDQLRQRDRLIAEMRQARDEADDLVGRLRENAENYTASIESWCEAFGMEPTDTGGWAWKPFWNEHDKMVNDYNDLVKRWNKYVPLINGRTQDVGRPLSASETQIAAVLKLHKAGKSLRWIVDDTSLTLQTVRTIVGRKHGTDRTTKKRWQRIETGKTVWAHRKAQKRIGDALPKRVEQVIETGRALITEAKGLGKR